MKKTACIYFLALTLFQLFFTPPWLLVAAAPSESKVKIEDAWIRATVSGQMGTGGFMKLTSQADLRLVGVSSVVAGVGEIHEMKINANDVMEMRAVTGLDLPKNKTLELKPGGYHFMLMDLKQTLTVDRLIPVTLTFKNKQGVTSKLNLQIPVKLNPPKQAEKTPNKL